MHQRWWYGGHAIGYDVCGYGWGGVDVAIREGCWSGGDGRAAIEVRGLRVWVRVGDEGVGMRVDVGGRGVVHADVAVRLSWGVPVDHEGGGDGRAWVGREEGRKELLLKAAS